MLVRACWSLLLLLWMSSWTTLPAWGEVRGRVVRIEAPVSPRMGLHEVEIYVGGKNIAAAPRASKSKLLVHGTGPKGVDINDRNHVKTLVDGLIEGRGVTLDATGEVNPWVEFDLGESLPVERLVIKSAGGQYRDRFWRLVTVLDEKRQVVWSAAFDMREEKWKDFEWEFSLAEQRSPLVGRVVPANSHGWARMSDFLQAPRRPDPPSAEQRRARFAERNSPAALALFARDFFARVDLEQPDLAIAKQRFAQGDAAGALDAWRDAFLQQVLATNILNEHEPARRHFAREADDLVAGLAVTLAEGQAVAWQIEPGLFDWGYTAGTVESKGKPDKEPSLAAARYNVLVHNLPRALLTEYAETGEERYLNQWSALLDDWGLHLQADLARSDEDIRDYFVKEPAQAFNFFCFELQLALRQRPELARKIPAATLARVLVPVLDEYGPAYWLVCRRAAFNHTFNALNASYTSARLLRHFHAGQRLGEENRQHWERIFTFNITRDGSMIEIGDEGHLDMHLRIGALYAQMQKDQPTWFTPQFRARFEESYAQTGRYLIRHMNSQGMGHRYGIGDHFPRLWAATDELCSIGNMVPRPRLSLRPIFAEAEARNIIETVFGRGCDRDKLTPSRQAAYDQVAAYYGQPSFQTPRITSDWMPYAGLHYLRRDWSPQASFMHVLSQPTGGGEANGQNWNTEFRYWDYGVPLLDAAPVEIDGRSQNPDSNRQTLKPGSKTERLTAASEQPIAARWHSSARFDLAETFYEGTFQRVAVNPKSLTLEEEDTPFVTRNARAERTIVQVRPARAFIIVDRVTAPGDRERTYSIDYHAWHSGQGKLTVDSSIPSLMLREPERPGVQLHHFSSQPATYPAAALAGRPRNEARPRTDLFEQAFSAQPAAVQVKSKDGLNLVSLVVPLRDANEQPVRKVRDLSTAAATGFVAEFAQGRLTWLSARSAATRLVAGPLATEAEALLWWEDLAAPAQSGGIVLGQKSLRLSDAPVALAAEACEFNVAGNRLTNVVPIHRPLGAPTILPHERVFTDQQTITISCSTPGAEIHYTLDGSPPTRQSPKYTGPRVLTASAIVQARAFRPGASELPFSSSGIDVSVVSYGEFQKRPLLPAAAQPASGKLRPGVKYEYYEASWFQLFSNLGPTNVLKPKKSGEAGALFDVSMRNTPGSFGVRYSAYLNVPETGVYTWHAPAEFVRPVAEPGYDLRVYVDGQEWDLSQQWQGLGTWSVPLEKGQHRLVVTFADARTAERTMPHAQLWRGYPSPWVVWKGAVPHLEISGPSQPRGPIPTSWLGSDRGP